MLRVFLLFLFLAPSSFSCSFSFLFALLLNFFTSKKEEFVRRVFLFFVHQWSPRERVGAGCCFARHATNNNMRTTLHLSRPLQVLWGIPKQERWRGWVVIECGGYAGRRVMCCLALLCFGSFLFCVSITSLILLDNKIMPP